jgi:hypothetical protein
MSEMDPHPVPNNSSDSLVLGDAKDSVEDETSPSMPSDPRSKIGRSISFGDVFVKSKIAEKALNDEAAAIPLSSSKDDTALPSCTSNGSLKGSGGAHGEATDSSGELRASSKRYVASMQEPPSLTLPESSNERRERESGPGSARSSCGSEGEKSEKVEKDEKSGEKSEKVEKKERGGSGERGHSATLPCLDLTSSAPPHSAQAKAVLSERSPTKEREKGVKKVKALSDATFKSLSELFYDFLFVVGF